MLGAWWSSCSSASPPDDGISTAVSMTYDILTQAKTRLKWATCGLEWPPAFCRMYSTNRCSALKLGQNRTPPNRGVSAFWLGACLSGSR